MLKEQKMLKRIKALIELKETGIIDEAEFEKRKRDILDEKSSLEKFWAFDENFNSIDDTKK
jgi:hypothetical protein